MPCNWIRPSLSCSQRSCYQERYLRVRWLEIEQLDARRLLAVAGHAVAGHAVTESFDNRVSNSTNVGGKTVGTEIGTLDLAEGEVLLISTAPGPGEFRRDLNTGEIANDTSNADQLFSGGDLGIDLTGEGLAVAIFEAGEGRILDTHQEFSDGSGGTRISLGDPGGAVTAHSTQVAGVIAATGIDQSARGVANEIDIRSYTSLSDLVEIQYQNNQFVASNHSYSLLEGWHLENNIANFMEAIVPAGLTGAYDVWYGDRSQGTEDDGFGKYSQDAPFLDFVLSIQDKVVSVWAAGNDRDDKFTNASGNNDYITFLSSNPGNVTGFEGQGWYLVPSSGATTAPLVDGGNDGFDSLAALQTAKNNIVVGAVFDLSQDPINVEEVQIASFSNFGPTDDGRIKPDLVANGTTVQTTTSDSDQAYTSATGTSFSAPVVTGISALLIQHYENLFGDRPLSSTTKGILLHTALDAGNVGPDYRFGWGVADAAAAADLLISASDDGAGDSVVVQEITYEGEEIAVTVSSDGSGPLKATIVWTDPQGPEHSDGVDIDDSVLVNDLDLSIIGPNGTALPWTLDPNDPSLPAVRTAENHVDNVEQVLIDAPIAGDYQVRISHSGETSTQAVSLIVSSVSGDFDASGIVDDADIDLLLREIHAGGDGLLFDLTGDLSVDSLDADTLINDILGTQYGDTNLDRKVDFADFVILSNHFDSVAENRGWSTADFTGDGMSGFDDFVILSNNFGFAASVVQALATKSSGPIQSIDNSITLNQADVDLSTTRLNTLGMPERLEQLASERGNSENALPSHSTSPADPREFLRSNWVVDRRPWRLRTTEKTNASRADDGPIELLLV